MLGPCTWLAAQLPSMVMVLPWILRALGLTKLKGSETLVATTAGVKVAQSVPEHMGSISVLPLTTTCATAGAAQRLRDPAPPLARACTARLQQPAGLSRLAADASA